MPQANFRRKKTHRFSIPCIYRNESACAKFLKIVPKVNSLNLYNENVKKLLDLSKTIYIVNFNVQKYYLIR